MKKYSISLLLLITAMFTGKKLTCQENISTYTFQSGNFAITTLSEGQQQNGTSILIDATPEIIKKYIPAGKYPSACNAFLVKTPDKTILIDAGFGRVLFDNLKQKDVTADKVDVILLTHMHGDHIGGLLIDEKVTFPNAELYIAQPEHDYWMNIDSRGGEQARKVIAAYKDKLHLFAPTDLENDNTELLSGIRAVAAYGHTPGHTAYLLKSDNEQFLVWGDLTHAMAIQMPHPEIAVTYDVSPSEAVIARKKILEYAEKNKIPVAGMHIAYPAMGIIKKANEGYKFIDISDIVAYKE
ncbi:MAG: MBL fold metallo-hydrolase [Prevotellaceae bacterium]|jgi:glyoxylase-like metal-dependent hydrolase (beta-lactamase superfamily II)|nr:MBL fold metallo-hydrolase [Prevotellaceae bacterium]